MQLSFRFRDRKSKASRPGYPKRFWVQCSSHEKLHKLVKTYIALVLRRDIKKGSEKHFDNERFLQFGQREMLLQLNICFTHPYRPIFIASLMTLLLLGTQTSKNRGGKFQTGL